MRIGSQHVRKDLEIYYRFQRASGEEAAQTPLQHEENFMDINVILLTWTLLFKKTDLSVVIDSLSQKGIVVSEYCPKMPYCEEGAHVMCMYYDPTRVMGPRCTNPKNVSMTSELASKLLEVSNAVRAKLAMGLEKGKGGVELPRAYGMFKLHWDNELATFAQVLANQCVLRHDMCRATKRFPDPGQTAGLIRFSSPDWIPVSKTKSPHFTKPGLMDSKITYAVTQALKTWYAQKAHVTPAMIIDYPDWTLHPSIGEDGKEWIPTKQNGRPFLEMISGPATHMGCGISAYAEYSYYEAKSPLNYNSMQVICNFAVRPKKHKSVYDLEPGPHTTKCGCPLDAIEDENCLCIYADEHKISPGKVKNQLKGNSDPKEEMDCDGVNCEQPVILLPIFTVEDAPPSKLINRKDRNHHNNNQRGQRHNLLGTESSLEFTDEDFPSNHSKNERVIVNVMNNIVDDNNVAQNQHQSLRPYLEKSPNNYKKSHLNSGHPQPRKTSIFSRPALISSTKSNKPFKLSLKEYKKDVIARKDFSKAKHLLNNYMESIKNYTKIQYRPRMMDTKDRKSKRYSSGNGNENDVEEIVVIEHDTHDKHQPNHNEMRPTEMDHNEITREDRDIKLMTLLDKLEEEVQHIELTGNKKELFDAKIRKIYDSVVGKSPRLSPKGKHISGIDDFGHGSIKKLVDLDHPHDRDHESDRDHDRNHEHDNMYKKELDHKYLKTDIAKTMDDIDRLTRSDDHRRSVDDNNDRIKDVGRLRIKARLNAAFNSDLDSDTDYDYRENSKKSLRKDKLGMYRNSDNEYKPHRFPDYRKSYKNKNQGYSHEDFKMNHFDEPRNGKRIKHRDYYKSSIESKNHYRRHQSRNNEWNIDDDVLSPERRKYYQERLENLERQLQNTRTRKFRNEEDRHRRPLRLPGFDDEAPRRPSKNRMEHFDMRERSRFLHGF